jgi:hypothetical protein
MPRKPIQYLLTFERKDDKGLTHKTFVTQTVYDGKPPVSPFAAKVERKRFKKLTAQVPARKPSDDWYRQQAINYALWLAKRDGIEIPRGVQARVNWSGVCSKTRMHTHKRWDGSLHRHPIYEQRAESVSFGREEPRYNKRKDGRQGAWSHNEFVPEVTIGIPNWDWQPDQPVEEIVTEMAA